MSSPPCPPPSIRTPRSTINRIARAVFFVGLFAVAAPCQDALLAALPTGFSVQLPLNSGSVSARSTEASVVDLRTITAPGWAGVAASWVEVDAGQRTAWSAISLDGNRIDRVSPTDHSLRVRFGSFDPRGAHPDIPRSLRARPDCRLWLVQWWTQGIEPYREAVRELGAVIHLFMPVNGQVVSMDAQVASRVAELSCVRAVVPFHPAYRLDREFLDALGGSRGPLGSVRVNILALRRGMVGQLPIAAQIEALGGVVNEHSPETYLMSATLGLRELVQIAHLDDVQWIDRWSPIGVDMDLARAFVGASSIETVGFTGAGVRGEIYDTGTELNHPELVGSIPHGAGTVSAHGTSSAGEVFARGLNPQAKGLCPQGTAIVTDANGYGGSRYAHTMQSVDPSGPYRAVFLTSSVGAAQVTAYSSISQNLDLIAFDTHLVHLQSQSNTGTTASRPEAWAKNVISVGGINHYGTLADTDDAWAGASIGPASDGRMKPNMAAFYDGIYTTTSGGGYTGSFGGTSGATPIVAGCVGLIHDMWHAGSFGNPTGATVFDSRPSDTLIRALLYGSATPWDFTGSTHNRARTRQGWGRPDLGKLHAHRDVLHWVDETDVLTNLQSRTRWVTVQPGRSELRVALVWADPPGTTSASLHRVNDLDLMVTSPTGVVYRGNWGMSGGVWSVAGGSRDAINTEECVAVPSPAAGTWQIVVVAADVNQDGHLETPAVDVDYSLVVLGAEPAAAGAPFDLRMSTSGGGVGDGLVGLDRVPGGTSHGFCLFSLATLGVAGSGPVVGLWPDVLTFQCVATPVAPGNPMHWTWPAPGVFPAVDLSLPSGSVALPAGVSLDGLGVAIDGQGGVLATTPVRRVTF